MPALPQTRPADPDIVALFNKYENTPLTVGSLFPDAFLVHRIEKENGKTVLEKFSTHAFLKDRKVVIFSVPGANTPTCTKTHLAGFVEASEELHNLGIQDIICLAPNKVEDAYTWNKDYGDLKNIQIWPYDMAQDIFKLGLALDMSGEYGQGLGMKRSAMIIENLHVQWIQIEEQPKNCAISHAHSVIRHLA